MMKEVFNHIGKRMPYDESEEYLSRLIDKATHEAITRRAKPKTKKQLTMMWISAAAVCLLVIGIGFTLTHHHAKPTMVDMQTEGPLDEFLSTLSDEEASQLTYFEIEEIPDY